MSRPTRLFKLTDVDGAELDLFDDGDVSDHLRLRFHDLTIAYLSPAMAAELAAQLTRAVEQRIPVPACPDKPVTAIVRARNALHRAHLHAASRRDDPAATRRAADQLHKAVDELLDAQAAFTAEGYTIGGDTR